MVNGVGRGSQSSTSRLERKRQVSRRKCGSGGWGDCPRREGVDEASEGVGEGEKGGYGVRREVATAFLATRGGMGKSTLGIKGKARRRKGAGRE